MTAMTIERPKPLPKPLLRTPADIEPLLDRPWAGLTLLQQAVLYVIGFHVDEDGVFRIPAHRIALLVGRGSDSRCAAIPKQLAEFGLLDEVPGKEGVRHWQLSRLGHAVYREISGGKE
jgi:hypothetical protein